MKTKIFNAVCKTRYLALLVVLIFTCGNVWGYTGTFTKSTGILTSGYYVIGNVENSTIHAINNTVGTSWIKYTDITISSSKITNPSNDVVWYYDASAGTIKNVDNTNYIYWTSGNVGCCGTTSYRHDVTETSTSGVYNIKSHATSARILAKNGTGGYRYYTGTQTKEIQFWKLGSTCSNKVTISKGSESHGEFELNKMGEQDACDALSVTVTPEAYEHYHVASVSATNPATSGTAGAAVDNGDGTWTITYSVNAKGASTVNVTFAENTKHTLTFYNNGAQVEQIQVYDEEKIGASLPNLTSSEACHATSRTFAGWTTENVGSTPVHTIDASKIVDYWTEPTADMSINALWATIPASATTTFAAADYSAQAAPVTKSKDNITLYFDAGSIFKTNTPYTFTITNGDHYFSITASNKVLAKLETTCNDGTYCIYDVSDGTLSPDASTASQIVSGINTTNVECYPKSSKQIRMQTCAVYCYDNYITACAACAEDPTEGSAALKGGFSLSSVGVTATGWDAGTNCSWTDYGFVWGTSANPTVSNNKVPVGNSGTTTTWDGTLTGPFTVGTTYYFRAYGKNGKDGGAVQYSDDATFTPRQVSFNMHGHGGDAPATQVVPQGGKATNPGDPSAAGYTFDGWWDNSSYTGSAWDFSTNTVGSGGVTLHAKWTEKPKYTITYHVGSGTCATSSWTQTSYGESTTLPTATPTTTCTDWEFAGWCTSSAGNAEDNTTSPGTILKGSYTPTSNITLHAIYTKSGSGGEPTAYSVGDVGDYVLAALNKNDDKWYAIPTSPTVSSGKISGVEITVNTSAGSVNYVTTSNATGYTWTIAKPGNYYTISDGTNYLYHSNGGASSTNIAYGSSTDYPWSITNDNGLVFAGVVASTSIVGNRGLLYQDNYSSNPQILNKFGGYALSNKDGAGYSRIQVLPISNGSTTYYMTGYTCCEHIVPAPEVTGTSTKNTITLSWDNVTGANGYTVTCSGGTPGEVTSSGTSRSCEITGLSPNTDYTWTVVATYTSPYCQATAANGSTTTQQVYAVSYNKNGGTIANLPSGGSYAAGETVNVAAKPDGNVSKSGYEFTGWNTQNDGQGTHYDADGTKTFTMPSSAVTLYAEWTKKKNYYVDRMHGTNDGHTVTIGDVVYNCHLREGANYTVPTISDNTSGASACHSEHDHLLFWVTESSVNADGTLKNSYTEVTPGSSKTATNDGTIYYAIWGKLAD